MLSEEVMMVSAGSDGLSRFRWSQQVVMVSGGEQVIG